MQIYFFAEHYPTPYKPYLDTQFVSLIKRGHDVKIFAGGAYRNTLHREVVAYGLVEKTSYYPVTLRNIPRFLLTSALECIKHPVQRFRQLARLASAGQSTKAAVLNTVRLLSLPLEAPSFCFIHNTPTAAALPFLRSIYRVPIALYFHGGEVGGVRLNADLRELFEAVDIVFTNTMFSMHQAIARGCEPDKIQILPVGFCLPDYSQDNCKKYRQNGVLRLISVGRIGEEKGHIYAIDAVRYCVDAGIRNISYRIVGTGQQFDRLKRYVQENKLEDVVSFAGEKDKCGVIEELRKADALILPSVETATWAETQACVVQEAMLLRLLVISTNAGGVPESLCLELHRFSVPPKDARAIAESIQRILDLEDSEMAVLGDAGRRFVLKGYDIERINEAMLDRILSERKSG